MSPKTYKNIQVRVTVSYKDSPRGSKYTPIASVTETIAMTETKDCQLAVRNGLTIPQMYGDFSSHQVQIEVTIPVSQEEVDSGLEKITEKYLQLSMPVLTKTINKICLAQGKDEFFKDGTRPESTTPKVKL